MVEGVGPGAFVAVAVSIELLKQLSVWSEPVQVMVVETPGIGTGYEMIARTWLSTEPNPSYCGAVERPHSGHVWRTQPGRWCPGDEVPGRPEPGGLKSSETPTP